MRNTNKKVAQEQPDFDPIYGTWLDSCLTLRGLVGLMLVSRVLSIYPSIPKREDYKNELKQRINCVVANALRARIFRETSWVAFNRSSDAYWNQGRSINGKSLGATVNDLISIGLLDGYDGEFGNVSSTYQMTPRLRDMLALCRANADSIRRALPPKESLIILRAGDRAKTEMRYTPTDETGNSAELLDRYNRFVEQHTISMILSAEEEADYLQREYEKRPDWDCQPKMRKPEFFNIHSYRIFNDGTWAHGGRIYRTWWQGVKREYRPKITIDGQKTIELDFSGFLPRSLYHDMRIDYPADRDPYDVPTISAKAEAAGWAANDLREAKKTVLIALLNSDKGKRGRPENVALPIEFEPHFTRAEVADLIAAEHPKLVKFFKTGEGKRNQRLDSDIALEILRRLMDQGIMALSIHDSFVVQERHRAVLNDTMEAVYYERLKYKPVIKDGHKE